MRRNPKEFARVITVGRLTMSAANVYTTDSHAFPYDAAKRIVPMVHRMEADYGFGTGDIPPADNYWEINIQVAIKQLADYVILEEEAVIFSHSMEMWQGAKEYECNMGHHGSRCQDFDPPMPVPFATIWLGVLSKNATNPKMGMVRIYYTLRALTAEELAAAIAQYSE